MTDSKVKPKDKGDESSGTETIIIVHRRTKVVVWCLPLINTSLWEKPLNTIFTITQQQYLDIEKR